jgi:hypothetical protein
VPAIAAKDMDDTMYGTTSVMYRKLDGGLNTRKSPRDIERNELASLVNLWYAYGTALSKRPGTTITPAGATGDGTGITSIVLARFNSITYIVAQTALNNVYAASVTAGTWVLIGKVAGGILRGAQMYDPSTSLDTLFLVTGANTPKTWTGPGSSLATVSTGSSSAGLLPNKPNTSTPIQPAYVGTMTNNSHLFYSGDSSAPCAVYISNPFFPQLFQTPAMQADPYGYTGGGGTFNPAIIGFNDGVDGGSITGIQTLGFAMIIFKQSAIYAMAQTQILGNVAWQVYNVSPQRGALSPRSIIAFENFICFLSIDGVYITFGQPQEQLSKQKISGNVPSYFDSTRFGQTATIFNRMTAVSGRIANRYLIFFDIGTGHPTDGVWFDFDVTADQGLPAAGEIQGMTVGGMASASGPADQGLLIWGDGTSDRVGTFGLGYSDFGAPIANAVSFKNDDFEQEFGATALLTNKVPARCTLLIEPLSQTGAATELEFAGTFAADNLIVLPASISLPAIQTNTGGGDWGQNWGAFNWSANQIAGVSYNALIMRPQSPVVGRVLQIGIVESSIYPFILVGCVLELNDRKVSR